jgi:hypothetical protein
VHTALAIRALLVTGQKSNEISISNGLAYISENWKPDPSNYQGEIYDVDVGAGYNRIALTHDVDAELVLTLILADPYGLSTPLWDAVAGWVGSNHDGRWWERAGDPPSIWTIAPRARAALTLSTRLANTSSVVRWHQGTIAISKRNSVKNLIILTLEATRPKKSWIRAFIFLISLAVGAAIIALAVAGAVDAQAAILGICLPIIIFSWQFLGSQKQR